MSLQTIPGSGQKCDKKEIKRSFTYPEDEVEGTNDYSEGIPGRGITDKWKLSGGKDIADGIQKNHKKKYDKYAVNAATVHSSEKNGKKKDNKYGCCRKIKINYASHMILLSFQSILFY